MAQAQAQAMRETRAVGWGAGLLAGIGAGIVAAAASVGVGIVMNAPIPPARAVAWSAFVAGVLGGLLYAWLSSVVSRPARWLWGITLALATIDSLLIGMFAMPEGRGPNLPFVGLVVPIRQLATLLGMGRLGTRHFPAAYLAAVTAMHYVTAIAVSILVPWWAGRKAK